MQNTTTSVLGFLMLFSSGPQQERPRELKGGGHLLGETAEHFFSESAVGQLLRACEAGDWKAVKQLAKAVDPASKPSPKIFVLERRSSNNKLQAGHVKSTAAATTRL